MSSEHEGACSRMERTRLSKPCLVFCPPNGSARPSAVVSFRVCTCPLDHRQNNFFRTESVKYCVGMRHHGFSRRASSPVYILCGASTAKQWASPRCFHFPSPGDGEHSVGVRAPGFARRQAPPSSYLCSCEASNFSAAVQPAAPCHYSMGVRMSGILRHAVT